MDAHYPGYVLRMVITPDCVTENVTSEAMPRSDIAGAGKKMCGWRPELCQQGDPNNCFGFSNIYACRHSQNLAPLPLKVWVLLLSDGCHSPPKLHIISQLITPILFESHRWFSIGSKGSGMVMRNILFYKGDVVSSCM